MYQYENYVIYAQIKAYFGEFSAASNDRNFFKSSLVATLQESSTKIREFSSYFKIRENYNQLFQK